MVEAMQQMLDGSSATIARRGVLLQLRKRLSSATSPDVVHGVLKQMRETFAEDLEEMKRAEDTAASQHEGLASAKAREVEAIRKQLQATKARAANGAVKLSRQRDVMERSQKLLDAYRSLTAEMQSACEDNTQAFSTRQEQRQ